MNKLILCAASACAVWFLTSNKSNSDNEEKPKNTDEKSTDKKSDESIDE